MGGRAVWLMVCGLLAGCGGAPPAETPEGEWVGVMTTTAGTCPDQQPSDLVVSKTEITFVPGDGVLALHGHRTADPDALHAQLLGLDMNHHPLPMVLDARFADGAVDGTYGTPTCRAEVSLHRPTRTGLQRVLGG
jgi:hypothetical protein